VLRPVSRLSVLFFLLPSPPPRPPLFPYTTLFRSVQAGVGIGMVNPCAAAGFEPLGLVTRPMRPAVEFREVLVFRDNTPPSRLHRSEEHTSELQSRENLVCRLLLEKKKKGHANSPS